MNDKTNSQLNTYWDNRFKRNTVKLLPGDYYACSGDKMIVTVLGSCISACLYESSLKIGGMNHFMLPVSRKIKADRTAFSAKNSLVMQDSDAARYGNAAMELLINEIIKRWGRRDKISAKIFGGASVTRSIVDIGQSNIDFVEEYCQLEGIPVMSRDVGGNYPRKLYFIPCTNEAFVKTIRNIHNTTIEKRETQYRQKLKAQEKTSDISYL